MNSTSPTPTAANSLRHYLPGAWRVLVVLGLALSSAAVLPQTAGYQIYVSIDGMQGEATAREYENWIEVLGFKHALRLESSIHAGGGGAAAKPDFDPLEITKYLDRTSPTLNHACASGKAIRTVKLDVVTIQGDRPHRLYQIVLDEVWVTAIGMVANPTSGEPRPIETVTLTFSKIRWVYWTPPDGSGGGQEIKEEWDVIAGKGA